MTHCLNKCIGHAAADDHGVGLVEQVVDNADLIGDLCAAEDRNEGTRRIVERLAHDRQLFFNEQAGVCRQILCNACGGGVSAVNGAECVGDIKLCHIAESLCEIIAVFLLADIKAEVLKQHELAGLQSGSLCLRILADYILCKDHVHTEQLGKALCNRGESELFLPLSLGLAKVGACDDGSAVIQQILDGRQGGNNALIACYLSCLLVLGNVKVAAQKHLLALNIRIEHAFLVVIHNKAPFRREIPTRY